MHRRILALLFVLATPCMAMAQPLPSGAIARLGVPRYAVADGSAVAVSPNGRLVAASGAGFGKPIVILDAMTGAKFREIETPAALFGASALAWSADDQLIASINKLLQIQMLDAKTGKALWANKLGIVKTKFAYVSSFRFVGNNQYLAVVCRHRDANTWHVELFEVATGNESRSFSVDDEKKNAINALGEKHAVRFVALSPSGKRMAWLFSPPPEAEAGESAVHIYDTVTGKLQESVRKLPRTHRVDMADEGETIVLYPIRPNEVDSIVHSQAVAVNVRDGTTRFRCGHRFRPREYRNPYSFHGRSSTDVWIANSAIRVGDSLLTFDEVGITRWDWQSGKKLDEYSEPYSSFALSTDGGRIAIRDGRRVAVSDGALRALTSPKVYARPPAIRFRADGTLIGNDADHSTGGLMHRWDIRKLASVETERIFPIPWDAEYLTMFDSLERILMYHAEKRVVTYDLLACKALPELSIPRTNSVALSANGKRILSYSPSELSDAVVVQWFDIADGREKDSYAIQQARRHSRVSGFPRAFWMSESGSLFGVVSPELQLVLIDCEKKERVLTVGITPAKSWKKPWWAYSSEGFDRLIWAKPFIPVGTKAASAEHALWDRNGRLLRRFNSVEEKSEADDILSHDGRVVARWISNKEVILYETTTGRVRGRIAASQIRQRPSGHPYFAFSPDCTVLATSMPDATILLWDLARPLSGKAAFATPTSVKEADALWHKLGDPDPTESDRALWALVKAPEHALAMLKDRLKPVPTPDAKSVQALVKKLDSGNFAERDAAQKDLRGMKESALSLLRDARKGASLEQARRLDEVILEMQGRLESPDAIRGYLREIRALEVLERIGTPEARSIVDAVARGGDAVVTYEAQQIVARWSKTR